MQRRRAAAKVLHRGEPVAASTEAQETAQQALQQRELASPSAWMQKRARIMRTGGAEQDRRRMCGRRAPWRASAATRTPCMGPARAVGATEAG
eukprot:CAMPEP_0177736550 /NCGR_PEP_ID=MMETSP0484_2-20121128/25398_1 /TAXON_ID=354590 /ORGANISM="Rhodomonas lens, Strain RHODO" /LENGTH=92 /DNA_ID=CAMNT_0019250245 /DNA_START=67 /DNA_END=342 /DNA_ORIENTATION=-